MGETETLAGAAWRATAMSQALADVGEDIERQIDHSTDAETALLALGWVSLADAVRITNRTANTIKGWIAASHQASHASAVSNAEQPSSAPTPVSTPARLFAPHEVTILTEATQGSGNPYSISLVALRRVHLARGGVYWAPAAAQAAQSLPPQVVAELRQLRGQVSALTAEVERLRAQLAFARRRESGKEPQRVGDAQNGASAPRPRPVGGHAPATVLIATRPAAPPVVDQPEQGDATAQRRDPISGLLLMPSGSLPVLTVARQHGFSTLRTSSWRGNSAFMAEDVDHQEYEYRGRAVTNSVDVRGQYMFGYRFAFSSHYRPCGRGADTCQTCRGALDRGLVWDDTKEAAWQAAHPGEQISVMAELDNG